MSDHEGHEVSPQYSVSRVKDVTQVGASVENVVVLSEIRRSGDLDIGQTVLK